MLYSSALRQSLLKDLLILVFVYLSISCSRGRAEFSFFPTSQLVSLQETQFFIQRHAKNNECLQHQVSQLPTGCRELGEEDKSRLALRLTNCFLQKSNKKTFNCSDSVPFSQCTEQMEGDQWNTYTTFFVHLDNLCFYYQSLSWESETRNLIERLEVSSLNSYIVMSENLNLSQLVRQNQNQLNDQIERSYTLQESTNQKLEENRDSLQKMKSDIENQTVQLGEGLKRQFDSINDVFGNIFASLQDIKSLQEWLGSHVADIGALIYYLIISLGVMILTSVNQFYAARGYVLGVLWVSCFVERLILNVLMRSQLYQQFSFTNNQFRIDLITLSRWIECTLIVKRLLGSYIHYEDPAHTTLVELKKVETCLTKFNSENLKLCIKRCLLSIAKKEVLKKRAHGSKANLNQIQSQIHNARYIKY